MRRKNISWIPLFSSGSKRIHQTDAFVPDQMTEQPVISREISIFLITAVQMEKNSTRSGKRTRALRIPPRATSMWLRSHMPGMCESPIKNGLSKNLSKESPWVSWQTASRASRQKIALFLIKYPSLKKVSCMNTFKRDLYLPWKTQLVIDWFIITNGDVRISWNKSKLALEWQKITNTQIILLMQISYCCS